jgi:regulator of sigma E protease
MMLFYATILLGILVFVHELGHFIVAKSVGIKVLKFSLGFGPKVVGKKYGETEYLLSAFPLGGYVKMLGEEPDEELDEAEKERAYNYQPLWKRFSVVFSGPLFNLFFAVVIFVLIFFSGVPVQKPDVGNVTENSPAARAGLMTGDRILEINETPVLSWDEIEASVRQDMGRPVSLKIRRAGETLEVSVTPEKKAGKNIFGESKESWDIGISPLIYPIVGRVMKDTPAEKAGLREGDRIIDIGGTELKTWQDVTSIIHENPGRELRFKIKRNDQLMELLISPEKKTEKTPDGKEKAIGLIGISPAPNDFVRKFGPVKALSLGVTRTWEISELTLVSIVKLIQRVIPAETIGGPILIFQMAGQQASHGAMNFFSFMAVISINLGILNLLPIPVLDGGHILFLGIEALRRKPLSEKVIMASQRVGLAVLLMLMAFAFYNDIVRLITGKTF